MNKHTWSPTWHVMKNVLWSTKILAQARLKQLGPTQNCETMTLKNLTTHVLLYFIVQREPHGHDGNEIAFG